MQTKLQTNANWSHYKKKVISDLFGRDKAHEKQHLFLWPHHLDYYPTHHLSAYNVFIVYLLVYYPFYLLIIDSKLIIFYLHLIKQLNSLKFIYL